MDADQTVDDPPWQYEPETIADAQMEGDVSRQRRRKSSQTGSIEAPIRQRSERISPMSSAIGLPMHREEVAEAAAMSDDDRSISEDVELDQFSDDSLQDDAEAGLTSDAQRNRRRRKLRGGLLDQRVAAGDEVTESQRREASRNVIKHSLVNVLLIGLWYLFSLSISIVGSL